MFLNNINKEMKRYEIINVSKEDNIPVMQEDGEYHLRGGYAVRNKETGVVEHTTTLLIGAIFQAQHFDRTLEEMLNPQQAQLELVTDEDTVLN